MCESTTASPGVGGLRWGNGKYWEGVSAGQGGGELTDET